MMGACWNERPDDRPSYSFVKSVISDEFSQEQNNSAFHDTDGNEVESGSGCSSNQLNV